MSASPFLQTEIDVTQMAVVCCVDEELRYLIVLVCQCPSSATMSSSRIPLESHSSVILESVLSLSILYYTAVFWFMTLYRLVGGIQRFLFRVEPANGTSMFETLVTVYHNTQHRNSKRNNLGGGSSASCDSSSTLLCNTQLTLIL